jgi:hypothetical protein
VTVPERPHLRLVSKCSVAALDGVRDGAQQVAKACRPIRPRRAREAAKTRDAAVDGFVERAV